MPPSNGRLIFELTCKPAAKAFQDMVLRIGFDEEFLECFTFHRRPKQLSELLQTLKHASNGLNTKEKTKHTLQKNFYKSTYELQNVVFKHAKRKNAR